METPYFFEALRIIQLTTLWNEDQRVAKPPRYVPPGLGADAINGFT